LTRVTGFTNEATAVRRTVCGFKCEAGGPDPWVGECAREEGGGASA
jgi:hypothetical protein